MVFTKCAIAGSSSVFCCIHSLLKDSNFLDRHKDVHVVRALSKNDYEGSLHYNKNL